MILNIKRRVELMIFQLDLVLLEENLILMIHLMIQEALIVSLMNHLIAFIETSQRKEEAAVQKKKLR